jgi:Predicted membrane protein (DUF2243)
MASSHVAGDGRDWAAKQTRRSIWSGVLAGVGLVAFIDETVFHQLLHWHHFYDKSTLAQLGAHWRRPVRRPDTWVRLTALIIAAAGHDTPAKLIYAWNLPVGSGPIASRHAGAELMYYGGTVVEVILAAVVMAPCYQISGQALTRTRRRSQSGGRNCQSHPPGVAARAPLLLSHLGRISRGARAGHKRTPRAQKACTTSPAASPHENQIRCVCASVRWAAASARRGD